MRKPEPDARIRVSIPAVACLLALSAVRPATVRAQSDLAADLFRLTWTRGVEVALDHYRERSPEASGAETLLRLADQLLWTGKRGEAITMLRVALEEGPSRARVYFEQGRARLQGGETEAARRRFSRGLVVLEKDTTLAEDDRERLGRRLVNRVRLLERSEALLERIDAYRTAAGHLLLFKFDPYLNTFPALVDATTGATRVLYPDSSGLHWRNGEGERVGTVSFRRGLDGGGILVADSAGRTTRAWALGIRRERVRFAAAGTSVEGTLFRPPRDGVGPAVVLAHGAGLSTRYNLAHEAVAFAAAGVAALAWDKPGLGGSTGANWLLLSIPEQAAHARAAAEALARRSDVTVVGAWGFSQGGWVAPLAATRSDAIAFVITASGAAVGPQEQAVQAARLRLEEEGFPEAEVREAVSYMRELWDRVNADAGLEGFADLHARADAAPWGEAVPRMRMEFELEWWRENEVDAGATLERLEVPVLAMFGEEDGSVPPRDNVAPMVRHLAAAPTGDFTVTVLPGADHRFTAGGDYQPLYFRTATDWVTARFGAAPRAPDR